MKIEVTINRVKKDGSRVLLFEMANANNMIGSSIACLSKEESEAAYESLSFAKESILNNYKESNYEI